MSKNDDGEQQRAVAWFSCGAASAVAALFAKLKYGDRCHVVYCNVLSAEHPDNRRFMRDMEELVGTVQILSSPDYASVDDVFEQTRYMAGIHGARCTVEMKKRPRFSFQRPDDIHIFGFTADEGDRIAKFRANNPELYLDFILQTSNTTKLDCHRILDVLGVAQPVMYQLGYRNNNCIGCVKATSARYWNMIRRDFPEVFERRAKQSRELGVRLTRYKGTRVFLDDLPAGYLKGRLENVSCGPECKG